MARKRHSDEDLLKLLRDVELKLTAGDDVSLGACNDFFGLNSVGTSEISWPKHL